MEKDYWINRWQNSQIGFDQAKPNQHLQDFLPTILPNPGRVFVPLCGKSVDMLWLLQAGHYVNGIELSQDACEQFMQQLPNVTQQSAPPFVRFESTHCSLWCGDFFALRPALSGPCDVIYDRAAMIALPASLRQQYVVHLQSWLNAGASLLLITLEYTPTGDLPPFSITHEEVHQFYQDFERTILFEKTVPSSQSLRERNIDTVRETVWHIK